MADLRVHASVASLTKICAVPDKRQQIWQSNLQACCGVVCLYKESACRNRLNVTAHFFGTSLLKGRPDHIIQNIEILLARTQSEHLDLVDSTSEISACCFDWCPSVFAVVTLLAD